MTSSLCHLASFLDAFLSSSVQREASELMQSGGPALWMILVLSIVAWALIVLKATDVFDLASQIKRFGKLGLAQQVEPNKLAMDAESNENADFWDQIHVAIQIQHLRDFELSVMPLIEARRLAIQSSLNTLSVIAALLPLIGLLGTVLGMMTTFVALTENGRQDTGSLAAGVSQALITTQAGLVGSLPVVLSHQYLSSHADSLLARLEAILRRSLDGSEGVVCSSQ